MCNKVTVLRRNTPFNREASVPRVSGALALACKTEGTRPREREGVLQRSAAGLLRVVSFRD